MGGEAGGVTGELPSGVDEWAAQGERVALGPDGEQVWVARLPAERPASGPPALLLHGFPTCAYDWRPIVPALRAERDVVVFDFVGFGLSDKPDRRYGIRLHADTAEAVAAHVGLAEVDLVTHDMGDTVGGELLARSLEGTLPFTVRRRVLTNGSIYLGMAHLSDGQQALMALPDARLDLVGADGGTALRAGLRATMAPGSPVPESELDALVALARLRDGQPLLPRTIRYLEDRRAEERRFTGAIERHPSPLAVVWGDRDPIAVVAMVAELRRARPDVAVTILDGVGHYPAVEDPARLATAVLAAL